MVSDILLSIILSVVVVLAIVMLWILLLSVLAPFPRRSRTQWGDSGRGQVPYPSTRSGGSVSTRYSTTTTTTTTTTPDDVEAVPALSDDPPTHGFTYKVTEPVKDVKYTLDHEPKSYVAGNDHGTASIKVVEHKHEPVHHTPSHDYGSSHSHSHSHDHGSSYSHDHSSHDYGSSHDSGGSWGND